MQWTLEGGPMKKPGSKPTYANVMATIAVFIALGGASYAAVKVPKSSVGTKQLKKNAVSTAKIRNKAVTTAKIRDQAITAAQVQNGTLTGTQINASTLGTVPVANLANSIAPPERWHLVGGAGEPGFQNGWKNDDPAPFSFETVGFYKDHEGIVHLKGAAVDGMPSKVIFQLPPGFRPAAGKLMGFATACVCAGGVGQVTIYGGNSPTPATDGAIFAPGATASFLEGVSFRAES